MYTASLATNSPTFNSSSLSCDNFNNNNQPQCSTHIDSIIKSNCDSIDGSHSNPNKNSSISYRDNSGNRPLNGNVGAEENGNHFDDSGYIALDQLLASLALENDIMERHLSQINNNDTTEINYHKKRTPPTMTTTTAANDVFSFEPSTQDNYFNKTMTAESKTNGYHDENLNDVLANLTEFSETESQRQQNGVAYTNGNGHQSNNASKLYQQQYQYQFSNCKNHLQQVNHLFNNHNSYSNHIKNNGNVTNTAGNHMNNNHVISNGHTTTNFINSNCNNHTNYHRSPNYQEPCINAIKRLTSESENSSSVSPSLSERSNGIVSWSDQVMAASASFFHNFVLLVSL